MLCFYMSVQFQPALRASRLLNRAGEAPIKVPENGG